MKRIARLLLLGSFSFLLPMSGRAATVAFYDFETFFGANRVLDSSGNGLDGTVAGETGSEAGFPRNAINMTADLNYVTVPASPFLALAGAWTVELYFKAQQPYVTYGSDHSVLIVKHFTTQSGNYLSTYAIGYTASGRLYAEISWGVNAGVGILTEVVANDNRWHHAALVFNPAAPTGDKSLTLYVDYVQRATTHGAWPALVQGNFPLYIGAGNYPGGLATGTFRRNFTGAIDQVRISDVALEPREFVTVSGQAGLIGIEKVDATARISWPTTQFNTYQPQWNSVLTTEGWQNFGGPFIGTGQDLNVLEAIASDPPTRFFRVIEEIAR